MNGGGYSGGSMIPMYAWARNECGGHESNHAHEVGCEGRVCVESREICAWAGYRRGEG